MLLDKEMISVYQQLSASSELRHIEAKQASGGIGDSVMQTVCAFANEPAIGHGYLLLGVSEPDANHNNYWISGINDTDKLLSELQNNCRNQFNTTVQIDAGILSLEGKKIIVVKVFELELTSKPCGFIASGKKNKNFTKTGVWRRGINGDYEARIDDLSDIIVAKTGQSFENIILPEATWADIDPDVISLYRKQRRKIKPEAAELEYSDTDLLLALNLSQKRDGAIKPNIAGLLLFGSTMALRRHLPMARVDYIRSIGTQWVENSDDRFMYTKDFREPIITMIARIEAIIMDDMPNHFRLDENELHRSDEPLLPQRVVREAVVNMIMHRDYAENQPSQVNRFKDRLELQNAGYSLKSLDTLDSASSVIRNPLIASVLYDLQLAETKGSGIRTIRTKLKQAGLSEPKFASDHAGNYFKATFLLHQLMDDKQLKWLEAFDTQNLSDDYAMALMLAHETGSVDNSTLRDITKLETLSASRILSQLCKKELLQKQGGGSSTSYTLTPYARSFNVDNTRNAINDQTYGANNQTSGANNQTSGANNQTSGANNQTSGVPKQRCLDFTNTPEQLEISIMIEEHVETLPNKASREQIEKVLLLLCQYHSFSIEQLAQKINRNNDYLRKNYIKPLINKGLIKRTFANENHPSQTYETTPVGEDWLKNID